mgnify:CR=1 FL=1
MEIDVKEISENPDEILVDENKLKQVIKDPDMVVELLTAVDKNELVVEVEGEEVELYKSHLSPEIKNKMKIFL